MATPTRITTPPGTSKRPASSADRTDWFFRVRRGPDGKFPKRAYARAVEQRARAEREQLKRALEMPLNTFRLSDVLVGQRVGQQWGHLLGELHQQRAEKREGLPKLPSLEPFVHLGTILGTT